MGQLTKLGEMLEMDPKQIQRYLLANRGVVAESVQSAIDVKLAREIAKMAGYPVCDNTVDKVHHCWSVDKSNCTTRCLLCLAGEGRRGKF